MADVFTKKKRSEVMAKIRSKSALEEKFRRMLSIAVYPLGIRYRKNYRSIPGSPDIAFVSRKIAVFIDGTFWHGYRFNRRTSKLPKKYWMEKIEENIRRDKKKRNAIRRKGWKVVRIWEHEFKKNPAKCIKKVVEALNE